MKAAKYIALLLCAAMVLAFAGCTIQIEVTDPAALAMLTTVSAPAGAEAEDPDGVQVYGGWYYTVSGGEATIVSTSDAIKTAEVILFPAELGGYPVTAIGANGTAVITNASGWVLIPEGVREICHGAFYDLNRTPGWSFPSTMSVLPETALDSCGGVFYAAVCPAAQEMGAATGHEVDITEMETAVVAGGTYHVPAALAGVDLSAYAPKEDSGTIDVYAAAAAAATVGPSAPPIIPTIAAYLPMRRRLISR